MKGEKERVRRRKEGQLRKAMVALLVFIMATLEIMFWPVGHKRSIGGKRFQEM